MMKRSCQTSLPLMIGLFIAGCVPLTPTSTIAPQSGGAIATETPTRMPAIDSQPVDAESLIQSLTPEAPTQSTPVDTQTPTPTLTPVPVITRDNVRFIRRFMVLEDALKDSILDLSFSPDVNLLASTVVYDPENAVSIWDLATGELVQRLIHHPYAVTAVDFSPDGNILATGSADSTIILWEVASWTPILELEGHTGQVRTLTFSPSGNLLASGGTDDQVFVWNATDGSALYRLPQGEGYVSSIEFSPDGRFMYVATGKTTVGVWSLEDGKLAQTISGRGTTAEVIISSDGNRIVLSSLTWRSEPPYDPLVRLTFIDLDSGEEVGASSQPEAAYDMVFSLDDSILFTASSENLVRAWDPMSGELLHEFGMHPGRVMAIDLSPDGRMLAIGTQTGHISLYGFHETRSVGWYEFLGFGCLENDQMVVGFMVPSGIEEAFTVKLNQTPYVCAIYTTFPNRAYCYGPRIVEGREVNVQLFVGDDDIPILSTETIGISCAVEEIDQEKASEESLAEVRPDCSLFFAEICTSCGGIWVGYDPVKDTWVCGCFPTEELDALCVHCRLNPEDQICNE